MTPFQMLAWASNTTFKERLRVHEKRLETFAMGTMYDSIAKGKLEQRQSEWLKEYDGGSGRM